MAALQEKLANIDFVLSMVHPHELSAVAAPPAQFAAMLRGTSKPLVMVPEDARHIELFMEMATACGASDSWAIYAMPTPPLTHGKDSVDRLVGCARLGIPMIYASAFLPGATAPASVAGCVVQANAEMLSGLVIAELASPGAPFVYGVAQGWMEPRSGHIVYCGPEEMAAQQASADLARFYGLPSFGGGGCSDSLMLDEQWAFETGMTLLTGGSSGVTLVHDLGYVASGTASSYETMVVADELAGWVKAYLNGVTIDEGSLAVAEMRGCGAGRDAPGPQVLTEAPAGLLPAAPDQPGLVRVLAGRRRRLPARPRRGAYARAPRGRACLQTHRRRARELERLVARRT